MTITNIDPHTTEIHTNKGTYLAFYDSIVAFVSTDSQDIILGEDWDYSRTTMKRVTNFTKTTISAMRKYVQANIVHIDKQLGQNVQ